MRARAHLLLRAQTCSSSVASPIAKIPKGDLEAMTKSDSETKKLNPNDVETLVKVAIGYKTFLSAWRPKMLSQHLIRFCL